MAKISRTWWGERFLQALESCTDAGRLQRGRSYAGPSRLLEFAIEGELIHAKIRGNVNPYFGVYKEPRYQVEIRFRTIPANTWKKLVQRLSTNAGWLSRLLLDEVPEDIEKAFASTNYSLLPHRSKDLVSRCSCPDWANPCKHVAGTYYHVARLLDHDPFLLFQLRGLTREALQKELAKSPLGKALATQLQEDEAPAPEPALHRYPEAPLQLTEEEPSYKEFWSGKSLPEEQDQHPPGVPALIIRRQGDAPPFWRRDNSFIEAMSEIYVQVQNKNKESL